MEKIFKFIINIILWIWKNIIYEFFYEIGLIIKNNWKNILSTIGIIFSAIICLIFWQYSISLFIWGFVLIIWGMSIGGIYYDCYNPTTKYKLLQYLGFGLMIILSLSFVIFLCTTITIKIFS